MRTNPWARFRYKAFISYSHADRAIAERIQDAIERFKIPRKLVGSWSPIGPVPSSLGPVFRDRQSLGASSSLDEALLNALEDSACLVVVCSPDAANSDAVNREIAHFKTLGRNDRVFAFIVSGEPNSDDSTECFPPDIKHLNPAAPDIRDLRGEGFDYAITKLASGILGLDTGVLQVEQNGALKKSVRRSRRALVLTSALAGMAVGAAIFAGYQTVVANELRAEAESNRQAAERATEVLRAKYEQEALAGGKPVDTVAQAEEVSEAFSDITDGLRDSRGRTSVSALRAATTLGRYRSNAGDDLKAEGELVEIHEEYLAAGKRLIKDKKALTGFFENQSLLGGILVENGRATEALSVFAQGPQAFKMAVDETENAELLSHASSVLDRKAYALRVVSSRDQARIISDQAILLSDRALAIDPGLDHAQRRNFAARWNSTLLIEDLEVRRERERAICELIAGRYEKDRAHTRNAIDHSFCLIEVGRHNAGKEDAIASIEKGIEIARLNVVNNRGLYDTVDIASSGYYRLAAQYPFNSPERHDVLRTGMELWADYFQDYSSSGMNTHIMLSLYFDFHRNLNDEDLVVADDIELLDKVSDVFSKVADDYPDVDAYQRIAALSFAHRVDHSYKSGNYSVAWDLSREAVRRCEASSILGTETDFSEHVAECLESYFYGVRAAIALDVIDEASEFYARMKLLEDIYIEQHPYDFYARKATGAAFNLANAFWDDGRFERSLPFYEYSSYWGNKKATDRLVEYYATISPDNNELEKYTALSESQGGMKRFTLPVQFGTEMHDFHIYVLDWPESYPYTGIGGQVKWLEVARGGEVKSDIIDAFEKLHNIARENKVSFGELSQNALGIAKKDSAE